MLVVMIIIRERKKSVMTMRTAPVEFFATELEKRGAKDAIRAIHSMHVKHVESGQAVYLKVKDPLHILEHE